MPFLEPGADRGAVAPDVEANDVVETFERH
jgi:hypothetical protein